MKVILSLFFMLCGSLSFAYDTSFESWPSINGLPINNACATANTLRSIQPVKTCVATASVRYAYSNQGEAGSVRRLLKDGENARTGEYVETETQCAAYAARPLEVSRNVTVTECAYYTPAGEGAQPCQRFVSKTVKTGLTFNVETTTYHGEVSQQTYRNYTIPLCAGVVK